MSKAWNTLLFSRLAMRLRGLVADRRGSVALFLAVAIVPLVAAIGASVDGARGWLVKSRLSQAVDAAGLAGGRVIMSDTRDADILMFFKANFPDGFMNAAVTGPTIAVDSDKTTITLDASATIPTTFMRVVGIQSITVRAQTVVKRTDRGMELVLVMDNTGSMAGSKITAMRNAATDLVNILYGNRETMPNFWIGLVPYVAVVNIGDKHADWTATPIYPSVDLTLNRTKNNKQTSTVCATTSGHSFLDGTIVDISNATDPAYNGRVLIRTTSVSGCSISSSERTKKFWYDIENTSAADGSAKATRPQINYSPGAWGGCVEARDPPYEEDQAEALPSVAKWKPSFWPSTQGVKFYDDHNRLSVPNGRWGDNDWGPPRSPAIKQVPDNNDAYGPNLGCGPAITPLQPDKTPALTAISNMAPWSRGGTMGNLGLAWAWRVLSPSWRGLWNTVDTPSPANLPLDYNTPLIDKVVVMLTDGTNQWYDYPAYPPGCDGISGCDLPSDADYTAYGRLSERRLGTTSNSTATSTINTRMSQLCTGMKNKGIIIYTIVLQESNSTTQNLYRNCASKPEYFFISPTAGDLGAIFKEIATQLSNLRLAQ